MTRLLRRIVFFVLGIIVGIPVGRSFGHAEHSVPGGVLIGLCTFAVINAFGSARRLPRQRQVRARPRRTVLVNRQTGVELPEGAQYWPYCRTCRGVGINPISISVHCTSCRGVGRIPPWKARMLL